MLIGRPSHIIDVLKKVEAVGIDEVILYFNVGLKPHALVKDEMARFMADIAPLFLGVLKRMTACHSTYSDGHPMANGASGGIMGGAGDRAWTAAMVR